MAAAAGGHLISARALNYDPAAFTLVFEVRSPRLPFDLSPPVVKSSACIRPYI